MAKPPARLRPEFALRAHSSRLRRAASRYGFATSLRAEDSFTPFVYCDWLPVLACEDDFSDEGSTTTAPLAMGECVTLRVHTRGGISAWVDGWLAPVVHDPAFAVHLDASEDAAALCRVDNGRG